MTHGPYSRPWTQREAPLVADVLVVHQLAMHHHKNSNIWAGSRTTRVGSLISKGAVQRLECEFSVRDCVVGVKGKVHTTLELAGGGW